MLKKNKRFHYRPRYNDDEKSYFRKKYTNQKSSFFLIIGLIILFLLTYFIINYSI